MTNPDFKTYIVTLKENAAVENFKKAINAIGGEIGHEYSLIKGFSIKIPSISASELHKTEGINTIEEDKENAMPHFAVIYFFIFK
ncbi:hypothetical protein JL09_g867 [Pichia kudriavzevii]|uniref:Uncharacterized protein n=1 Tax=Pichia kudriavzevii TaxID=4909 RepID=A0A099P4L6_PICKU|nr:hypothetical protein JL09_g867 [Pichia kudriavzevii]